MQHQNLVAGASLTVLIAAASLTACGSSKKTPAAFDTDAGSGVGGDPTNGGSNGGLNTADAGSTPPGPPVVGWLEGRVVAPEGTIPVSNAIVYLTSTPPDAIPTGVYCDTCIHLSPLEPYAYSGPDGSFQLGAYATGQQYLVVQKGQFRRVRPVTVAAGDQTVQGDATRLPGKNDTANGDTIPMISMVVGGYDHIDVSMSKLGIQEFYRYGDTPFPVPGPTPPGTNTKKSYTSLIGDTAELAKYNITLLPCASFGYTQGDDGSFLCGAPDGTVQNALNVWVQSGGKLYVTDFSYEAVRQTWPGFINFYDATMQSLPGKTDGIGTACRGGAEDSDGIMEDKGLSDWMTAIGETNIQLKASWTRVESVSPQPGVDPGGNAVTITPKVWMTSDIGNGEKYPATMSFEQRCGRVLFSTYHCEGDANASTLLAQEKALLYVLLEVGVCVGQLPPPPPPR